MHRRTYLWLLFIAILAAGAIFVDLPNTKGIHIAGYNNSLKVQEGLDLQGGVQITMQVSCPSTNPHCQIAPQMGAIIDNLNRRISEGLAVNDAVVRTESNNRVLIQLPDLTNEQQALKLLGTTGQMNVIDTGSSPLSIGTDVTGQTCTKTCASGQYKIVFTGAELNPSDISAEIDSSTNQPAVQFEFQGAAQSAFATYTQNNIGNYLTITLDNKVIESASIESQITGVGEINGGNMTLADAENLASLLKYGALPLPLAVIDDSQVAPTLGQQALNDSLIAGIIGLAMVMIYMLLYYRLPGLLADVALCLYASFLFAVIKILGIQLSLPAIAATVLTIGMAVDANVLIFERIKEELRSGRTMVSSIDLGFKRAWPSIRDSNASTMITCVILYWFGNNFGATVIVGFAISLGIGVAISLFTAVTVTRTFLNLLVLQGVALHPWLYGLPANSLNVGHYKRPTSRVAARPAASTSSAALASAGNRSRYAEYDDDEDDEDDDEQPRGSRGGTEMEPVGNVRNGRSPSARRQKPGASSGNVEE
ncbi:MAG: protein translocase subunit SecD [Ktedonobacterales bacterium]